MHLEADCVRESASFASSLFDCGDQGRDSLLPANFPETRERVP
jgi:hypothetical protein